MDHDGKDGFKYSLCTPQTFTNPNSPMKIYHHYYPDINLHRESTPLSVQQHRFALHRYPALESPVSAVRAPHITVSTRQGAILLVLV